MSGDAVEPGPRRDPGAVGSASEGRPGVAPLVDLTGPDLARSALAQAKARARERGASPRTGRPRRSNERSGSSGEGRDPLPFGAAIQRLVTERGWQATTTAARVVADWDRLVGPEIADHCRPDSLVEGELVLVAESSAWATQLRLMSRQVLASLARQVGPEVVQSIVVRGPAQPDWRRGPRRVQGRGPRDTYG